MATIKLLLIFLTFLLLSSCTGREYKYRINGYVSYKDSIHSAIFYTDTFALKGDTVYYANSDGSVMSIAPPYAIDTLK
jgi:hypothetical protein